MIVFLKKIWIIIIYGPLIALTPDFFATAMKKYFKPNPVDLVSRLQYKESI